jgi:hypothetical protein
MLMLIASLMADPDVPSPATSAAMCDVGRMALKDLHEMNSNPQFDAYYDAANPVTHACPALRHDIPAGFRIADRDAWARANVHAPIPGKTVRPALIYSIGLPRISDDLQTATVSLSYTCTGLCGGSLVARYVRTAGGWRRDGTVGPIIVS